MSGEPKDPAIKLFGKTIPLPELPQTDPPSSSRQLDTTTDQDTQGKNQTEAAAEYDEDGEEDDDLGKDKVCGVDQLVTSSENSASVSGNQGSPGTPPVVKECSTPKHLKPNEKQNVDNSAEDGKTALKKPDKILPCPRCNSMETKFCYYNNYNMNQPRHFCRNCQRYWTAGGTMRNVPVGAGRRKNKSSSASSNNRHPFPLAEARPEVLDRVHHSSFEHPGSSGKTNQTRHNLISSQGLPSQVPCFPEAPWAYPWVAPLLPPQLCSQPVFPMPIYPVAATAAAYWGCGAMGRWSTVPGMPQPYSANVSAANANSCSSIDSSTLGKHPREGAMTEQDTLKDNERQSDSGSDRCLWIPKTLRIDDPSEAAKSSLWATLGINKTDSASKETRLKAFQPKVEKKNRMTESSPALLVNPAAMSRSFHFHESS